MLRERAHVGQIVGGRQKKAVTKEELGHEDEKQETMVSQKPRWTSTRDEEERSRHVSVDAKQDEGLRISTIVTWWDQRAACTKLRVNSTHGEGDI